MAIVGPTLADGAGASGAVDSGRGMMAGGAAELAAGGYRLRLRPPTSADLLALGEAADAAAAEALLLARCVSVEDGGPEADQLPAPVIEAAVNALAELDPAAGAAPT